MLKFGNKEFRNLQEQVEKNMKDILFILQEEGVLNEFGIKVVGQEDTAASMPTVSDYKENNPDWAYGDAYAIGTEAPYTLYILTRANGTHPNDYWFNIGSFPVTGPQGPQGPQGEVGPQGQTGNPGTNGLDAGFGTISATAETVSSTDPATVTITTSGPNTAKNISFAFEIPQGEKGKDGVSEWGHIDGSIDNQTDLVNALQAKQNASNAVTTDGTQTITGQKTFSNGVYIGPQMSIDSLANSTILDIKRKGATEYRFATGAFLPNINNNYSLGTSVYKWKDLYLSGNLTDGTNSISVADIASKSEYATKKDFDDLKSIVYGIHSLTYNSYEFPYLTTSIIPDEVDGRKVVGGSYAIMDWVGGNSMRWTTNILGSNGPAEYVIEGGLNGKNIYLVNSSGTWREPSAFSGDMNATANHKYLAIVRYDETVAPASGSNPALLGFWNSDSSYTRASLSSSEGRYRYGVFTPNKDYLGCACVFQRFDTNKAKCTISDFRAAIWDLTANGDDSLTYAQAFAKYKDYFDADTSSGYSESIKSTIVTKIESWGANLFNGEFEQGGIDGSTGQEISANTRCRTDYLEVIGGKTYYLNLYNTTDYSIMVAVAYDKDKKHIQNINVTSLSNGLALPLNSKYLRFVVRRVDNGNVAPSDLANIQFMLGCIKPYVPYVGKLGQINIPNAPLKLDGVNDIHNTLTFEEQEDGTYNAILKGNTDEYTFTGDEELRSYGTAGYYVSGTILNNAKTGSGLLSDYFADSSNDINPIANGTSVCARIASNIIYFSTVTDGNRLSVSETLALIKGKTVLYPTTTPTSEVIATGLSFDDTTFKIEKGGTIKAIYDEVPPTISLDFMTKGE